MPMKKNQQGVGLVEVMVALLVLALALLGFIVLQYKAVDATVEGTHRIQAMSIARDLAERMRINRVVFDEYQKEIKDASKQTVFTKNCYEVMCNAKELADFDVAEVTKKAQTFGISINMMDCQGTASKRQCIYMAWNDTSATDGTGVTDCTSGTKYKSESTCLIMEAY